MRFKQFNEMYDPFTSNGFERNYEDNEEIRYERFYRGRIQRIQIEKIHGSNNYTVVENFCVTIRPNQSVQDWWNYQFDYKNEKELYEGYKKLNNYLLDIFNRWENYWDYEQVNAAINKKIFNQFQTLNEKVLTDNNEVVNSIKDIRRLINTLLIKYKKINDFNGFILESTSIYLSYVIKKYKYEIEYDKFGRTIIYCKDNEACKWIDCAWVVSGFWYFGDDDYLERGASGGRIWMEKPVKNPKWKEQNPDYIIE